MLFVINVYVKIQKINKWMHVQCISKEHRGTIYSTVNYTVTITCTLYLISLWLNTHNVNWDMQSCEAFMWILCVVTYCNIFPSCGCVHISPYAKFLAINGVIATKKGYRHYTSVETRLCLVLLYDVQCKSLRASLKMTSFL